MVIQAGQFNTASDLGRVILLSIVVVEDVGGLVGGATAPDDDDDDEVEGSELPIESICFANCFFFCSD